MNRIIWFMVAVIIGGVAGYGIAKVSTMPTGQGVSLSGASEGATPAAASDAIDLSKVFTQEEMQALGYEEIVSSEFSMLVDLRVDGLTDTPDPSRISLQAAHLHGKLFCLKPSYHGALARIQIYVSDSEALATNAYWTLESEARNFVNTGEQRETGTLCEGRYVIDELTTQAYWWGHMQVGKRETKDIYVSNAVALVGRFIVRVTLAGEVGGAGPSPTELEEETMRLARQSVSLLRQALSPR